MRLVEAVAPERLDLGGDVLDDAAVVAPRHRALHKPLQVLLDQLLDLLAHGLAQHVRFGERVTRQKVRDPHHLLLVGDDAVRGPEHLLERGVWVADAVAAQLAVDEDEVHARVEGPGAEQRVACHQVVEPIALHVAQRVGRERRLELEHAGGAPRAEQPVHRGILEVERVHVERRPVPLAHHGDRVVDHGQRLQAQDVDLQHPDLLEPHHVVLRDDGVRHLGRDADGDVLRERTRGDHDARGVHRGVPGQALDARAEVEHLTDPLVLLGGRAQVGHLLGRFREAQRVGRARRDRLGEPIHVSHLEAQRAGDVAERRPRLQRPEGDDLAHGLPPVARAHVFDHLAPPLEAEVEVDVGHRHPLGIEEALEQQVELEGIDARDAERVRDQRAGGGAASRAHGDAAVLGGLDEVVDDQEVPGVAGAGDDVELVLETLLHVRRQGIAVAAPRPVAREMHQQVGVARELRGARVLRQEVALLEVELAQGGQSCRLRNDVRPVREQRTHLRLRLDVALPPEEPEPVRVVEILSRADGEQHVVGLGVVLAEIVRVVRRHHGHPQLGGQPEHALGDELLLGDAVALDLQPEAVRPEQVGEIPGARLRRLVVSLPQVQGDLARQARGERDQPVLVPLQHFTVDARPAVIALEEADGRELDEVAVAGAVAGEQHEVRVVGGGAAQPLAPLAAPEGEVRLEPEDRPYLAGLRLGVELPGAVEVAVIRDRQRVHAERLDVVQQIGNAVRAVEEGVFAVRVKVYERHLDYRAPARRSSSSSTRSKGSRFASSSTRRW